MGSAMASLPWGWPCHPRRCDLKPIGRQDVFQHLHISKCGQGLHSTSQLQHTFCKLAKLTWGRWLGLFCPMLEGLCVCQGLLQLHQMKVLVCQIACLRGARINPGPGSGVLVVQSNHLLSLHGILLWGPERMPAPSWQILGCHLGQKIL